MILLFTVSDGWKVLIFHRLQKFEHLRQEKLHHTDQYNHHKLRQKHAHHSSQQFEIHSDVSLLRTVESSNSFGTDATSSPKHMRTVGKPVENDNGSYEGNSSTDNLMSNNNNNKVSKDDAGVNVVVN